MAVQKGKVGTRGQKQIMQENKETLDIYLYMCCVSSLFYLVMSFLVFESFPTLDKVFYGLSTILFLCCYKFMSSMATPRLADNGAVLDEGTDLNMQGGISEHIKDMIILTSITLMLSTISTYFWLIWLLAPIQILRLLWVNILGPWFFQEGPPEELDERAEKKRRKMERRMKYQ